MEGVNVLEDVALSVGYEDHVKLVEGLVNEANVVLFNGRMLSTRVSKFRERGQESFDSRSGHFPELPREDSFPASGANRGCENNL